MSDKTSAFTRFERDVRARSSFKSVQPREITVTHNHGSVLPKLDMPSPPWFADRTYPMNENGKRYFSSQCSRPDLAGPALGEMAKLEGGSVNGNQSLPTRPIKAAETNMHTISQGRCETYPGSMLPPIHFILGLLRYTAATPPDLSQPMQRFSGWTMPLNDVRHPIIASQHSSDQPSSRPDSDPPTRAGPPAQDTTTLDKKRGWRRAPQRWGLAEWERDDSDARERRREQNREAQRRFREDARGSRRSRRHVLTSFTHLALRFMKRALNTY
jgi:hypothetical protein